MRRTNPSGRAIKFVLFPVLLCAASVVFAQSRFPQDPYDWLATGYDSTIGARDIYNVTYFEVPESVNLMIYFAVRDPGANNVYPDQGNSTSTFYLLGNGCMSAPNARNRIYASDNQALDIGYATQLGSINAVSNGWEYFPGVLATQGQKIGNKYYFRIVAKAGSSASNKDSYQLDVSYSRSATPTGVAGIRAFAYALCLNVLDDSDDGGTADDGVIKLYPFVPDTVPADGSYYIVYSNWDMDVPNDYTGGDIPPTGRAYNKSSADMGAVRMSNNAVMSHRGFVINAGQNNGTWRADYGNIYDPSLFINTAEIWFWYKAAPNVNTDTTAAADITIDSNLLRMYSSYYPEPAMPDHVTITAQDGIAPDDGTERLVLQLVDAGGTPVPYVRNIYVRLTATLGSPRISAASNSLTLPLPVPNAVIQTDASGFAWIEITCDEPGDVTVELFTNGAAVDPPTPGTGGPPWDDDLPETIANQSALVAFQANPHPQMSSASNSTFTEGNAFTLPMITITEVGGTAIRQNVNIIIRIPSSLNAQFDITGLGPTLGGTIPRTLVQRQAGLLVIRPDANAAIGQTLTISGLRFTAVNSDSGGRLEMSYDNGADYNVSDDKIITILDVNTTYTWVGGDPGFEADWNRPANWLPNNVPGAAENAVIPAAPVNQPRLVGTTTIKNLTIENGASVTLNTQDFTVSGTLKNEGRLRIQAAETVTLTLDTDSGIVEYYGASGGSVRPFGGTYNNFEITGGGMWTLPGTITVAGTLTLTNGTLDCNGQTLNLSNNLSLSSANGTLQVDTSSTLNLGTRNISISNGTLTHSDGTITARDLSVLNGSYDGTGDGTVTLAGDLSVSGGTLTLGNKDITCVLFSQSNGTFSGNTGSVAASGNISITNGTFEGDTSTISSGGDVNVSGGTHTADAYTLVMSGANNPVTYAGGRDPFNFEVNSTGTVYLGYDMALGGACTITAGTLDVNGHDLSVGGNWTNSGGFDPEDRAVTFNSAGGTTISINSGGTLAGKRFNNISFIDGTAGAPFPVYLLVTNNLYCAGALSIGDNTELQAGGRNITVGGNWNNNNTGTFTPGSGTETVTLGALAGDVTLFTGGAAAGKAFNRIVFDDSGALPSRRFTLDADLDVNGSLAIASGILDASVNNRWIYIAGDWTGNGTFEAQNGTVVFDGACTMQTDEDFYNLTITDNAWLDIAGRVITTSNTFNIENRATPADADGILYRNGSALECAPRDIDSGSVHYRGAGGGIQFYGTDADPDYFDLYIDGAGTFVLAGNVQIERDLAVTGGVLETAGNSITLRRDFNNSGGAFTHQSGAVIFIDNGQISNVYGDNTFYDFICENTEAGKTIRFEAGSNTTIANGGTWRIQGLTAQWSYVRSSVPGTQWYITMASGSILEMAYVDVDDSNAVNTIITPPNVNADTNCTNWITLLAVSGGYSEDSDGNGKIDRIRIMAAANLNDVFAGLAVVCANYAVNTGIGTNGCTTGNIPGAPLPTETNDETFYVWLIEKPDLDTFGFPDTNFQIPANTTLSNGAIPPAYLEYGSTIYVCTDNARPVIGYSLAVAERNKVFIHASEPLYDVPVWPGAVNALSSLNFSFAGANPSLPQNITSREYLLTFPAVVSINQISNGDNLTYTNIRDQAGNQLGGVAVYNRRVSDLILAMPGFEPVTFILYDNSPIEPGPQGIGYIDVFDGSEWLPDQPGALTLQGTLSTGSIAELIWYADHTNAFTNIPLWYPNPAGPPAIAPVYGLVTQYLGGARTLTPSVADYSIPFDDAELVDETLFEFYIRFTDAAPGLLHARLARPNDSDWYRSVRPFAFGIHKPGGQKGGVEVYNNVINPNLGERTKIRYTLPRAGNVTIQVFTLAGDLVHVLYTGWLAEGQHSTVWEGRNKGGRVVARGLYFIKVVGPSVDETRKVLVVK